MDSIIGLLIGLLEAGLALWFLIELISNTCFQTQNDAIYKIKLHISEFFCIFTPVFMRNPGRMLIPVEEFYAGSRSKCRNPLLQNMFRFIGFGEKAGSGADIIAKGWEENHWARPTIKDSYFPSEETELILDLLKEGGQTGGQSTTQTDSKTSNGGLNGGVKSRRYSSKVEAWKANYRTRIGDSSKTRCCAPCRQ